MRPPQLVVPIQASLVGIRLKAFRQPRRAIARDLQ
jgi:hypothetical protein